MEKTLYHHLPDGSFRNPEGSPERNSNFKWSFKVFNKEKKKLNMTVPDDHVIDKQRVGTGILLFAALISINLAVLNSLPLPLLDGGQLVFTLIEGFRGEPVPVKVQIAVTQSSFFLLVGLSVLLIIRDTSQLLIVQRLLSQ